MKKSFLIIYIFSSLFFMTGCTQAEIENKANEAGNVVGRLIKGASEGVVEGLSGEEQKLKD